jgi:uncharacterized membrane-anchored protein
MNARSRQMLNKVPEVTIYFWIVKIMATTVGETAADFLIFNFRLGLTKTSIVMGIFLVGALLLQLWKRRYVPWIYWVAVVFLSIFGTLITDNLSDNFGVALTTTTAAFSIALIATFARWFTSEKTLSIHSIFTIGGSFSTGRQSCSPSRSAQRRAISSRKKWGSVTASRH